MAPLIVITGPTASGKSGLALDLAERYQGEIICADSRTVYKGMDIGTAKPSREEQTQVPHHLLDVVEPDERFTVHEFQRLARVAIEDIRARGRVPFLVGGTGLYIDSVVLRYDFPTTDKEKKAELEEKSIEELTMMIKNQHLTLPENSLNKRHLVGELLRAGQIPQKLLTPDKNTYVVAISTDKETLVGRIERRAYEMFAGGVIEEAKALGEKYGWEGEALSSNIYPILHEVILGHLSMEGAIERCIIKDRQLAKRQITWLKRHSFVRWLSLEDARNYVDGILANSGS